jgi:hypothetical protein
MNDDSRKRLCKLIGRPWYPALDPHGNSYGLPDRNPKFSTPTDAQDVKDALVEKGLWDAFLVFAFDRHHITAIADIFSCTRDENGNITGYRLCELAGEFNKEEGK